MGAEYTAPRPFLDGWFYLKQNSRIYFLVIFILIVALEKSIKIEDPLPGCWEWILYHLYSAWLGNSFLNLSQSEASPL